VSSFRALPPYDGSIGPLPAHDVDNNYLLARYGITKPTLFKRRDALVERGWVVPQRTGNRVFYAAQDVHLLDSVNFWASQGYSIPEIVQHLRNQEVAFRRGQVDEEDGNAFEADQPIDVGATNTTTDLVVKGIQTSAKDLQLLGEEFVEKFAQRVSDVVKEAMPRDVLAAHDFLAKAADKKYLLTGAILAQGLGFKSTTISSWGDRNERLGFVIKRAGTGRGMWRVERMEGEEGGKEAGEMVAYFRELLDRAERGGKGEAPTPFTKPLTAKNARAARDVAV